MRKSRCICPASHTSCEAIRRKRRLPQTAQTRRCCDMHATKPPMLASPALFLHTRHHVAAVSVGTRFPTRKFLRSLAGMMRAIMLRALLGALFFVAWIAHAESIVARDNPASRLQMNPDPSGSTVSPPPSSHTQPSPSSSAASSTTSTYEGEGPPPGVDYPSVTLAKPAPVSSVDVYAKPSSLPQASKSASSNVSTAQIADVAIWGDGPLPSLISNMYRGNNESIANLPKFYFNLANSSLPKDSKQLVCDIQVDFCKRSGCEEDEDELEYNFCDVDKGMATMCKCKKSVSRLAQYQWPVQSSDCQIRRQTCKDVCNNKRETHFRQRAECIKACEDQIGSSCDKPEQYGSSYMVSSPGKTPSYHIVDQSNPQGAGAHVAASVSMVLVWTLATCVWLSA